MKQNKALKKALRTDISESEDDKKHLQNEETIMDLPDVEDIPGQEHIHPPKMKAYNDVTISSDDEEGKNIIGFNDEDETDDESNVSDIEKELLQRSSESMASEDDEERRKIMLDNKDDDGVLLNEKVNYSGSDLDIPSSEEDDENEEIGEEDEENNNYSLGGDRKD